ncbi:MAG: hypothetical protein RLZZ141_736 [Pseudomonadota bacterium]|jgi:putative oxidoreductase
MLETAVSSLPKWRLRAAWSLQLGLAIIFAFTASRKFLADPVPVATIEALGTGQWLRIAIGLAELAGAIGLLVPRFAGVAGFCLALLMLGAAGAHIFMIGGSPIPALVLFTTSALVAYLRGVRFNSVNNL